MIDSNVNNLYKILVTNLYQSEPNINMYSKQQLQLINAYLLYLTAILINPLSANFILQTAATSYEVSNNANLTINIRTSTIISALDVVISNSFIVNAPSCYVNSNNTSCIKIVPPSGGTITIRFIYNFSTATNYTLMFNLVNPSYSDTFSIQAFNGWTSFRNSGSVAINPKTIRCSIASNSQIVSQL